MFRRDYSNDVANGFYQPLGHDEDMCTLGPHRHGKQGFQKNSIIEQSSTKKSLTSSLLRFDSKSRMSATEP
jgi:hypothetical protein